MINRKNKTQKKNPFQYFIVMGLKDDECTQPLINTHKLLSSYFLQGITYESILNKSHKPELLTIIPRLKTNDIPSFL